VDESATTVSKFQTLDLVEHPFPNTLTIQQ